jgi:carboxyl-terminal processing protease
MNSKFIFLIAGAMVFVLMVSLACTSGFILGRFATPTPPAAEITAPPEQLPETSTNGTERAVETPVEQEAKPHVIEPEVLQPAQPSTTVIPRQQSEPVDLDELFKPFWETWEIINRQYVDQPLDHEEMMQGAIRGMLESLGDQHTSYMDPDQFRQANIPLEQEYEGIGAWVDTTADFLTIVSPMPGSPAENAGLRPGDRIIAIDGEDMTGIDGNLVIRRVLGPAGSTVQLTISRDVSDRSEPHVFDVEITRARITVPSVESRMLDDGIAYIKLFQFADNTREELRRHLRELMDQNPTSMILDLRNNGGGYLHTSIEVASEFIADGTILIEEYGDGRTDVYTAIRGGLATDIPLVVLINDGSASASEIVAGAIQDYGRAPLVGSTSFGKGSVQNWVPLSEDQGAVRVTIARWLTPEGRQIHSIGLAPDYEVEVSHEDITEEHDPQLDKAVEILQNRQ